MRLKTFTTGLFIFGVVLLLGFPFLLGTHPGAGRQADEVRVSGAVLADSTEEPRVSRKALAEYGVRIGVYTMVMLAVWIAVIVCTIFLIRNVRREVSEMAAANMRAFVEGTLHDHAKLREKGEADDGDRN